MKKVVCLLLAALMLFSVACAGAADMRKEVNPNDYPLIDVCDTWIEEYSNDYIVQGSFGDMFYANSDTPEVIGFEPEEAYPLVLSPDAVIGLPNEGGDIVPATVNDLFAYIDVLREQEAPVSFICEFEMNADGVLTKLSGISSTPNERVASREFFNPNNYTTLKVVDVYQCDDDDFVVCGSFGDYEEVPGDAPIKHGFDTEPMTIIVAPDAVIEMSANLCDEDNVPMTLPELEALVAEMQMAQDGEIYFYCDFDMTDDGVLTKLIYSYQPF